MTIPRYKIWIQYSIARAGYLTKDGELGSEDQAVKLTCEEVATVWRDLQTQNLQVLQVLEAAD